LLDAGADPTLINFKLSTPLQLAAEKGFLPALEDCLKRFPQLVNQKNDDGLTLLHLAALNNHKDIAIFLLKQVLLP
jgi:E3 ubiquitin-protein ligase mind-bomb